MKSPSHDLFDLIHSLNKNEKGYFKRHSAIDNKGADTRFNVLFDAINDQEKYDEKAIIEKYRNQPFTRQFSVAKTYLFNRILKAMHAYHSNDFEELRSNLHYVEILQDKGFYDAALKVLQKTKEFAIRRDLLVYMPAILRSEYILAGERYDYEQLMGILEESNGYLEQLLNTNQYRMLVQAMALWVFRNDTKTEKERATKIEALIKDPLLVSESKALNFLSRICFYEIHSTYWYYKKNNEKCLRFSRKKFDLFNQHLDKTPYHEYFITANNLLYLYLSLKRYKDFEDSLEQVKKIFPLLRTTSDKGYYFSIYYTNFLRYMNQTGQFEKAAKLLPGILKEYAHYEAELAEMEKVELNIIFAVSCFGMEKYDEALKHLNKIRNEFSVTSHDYIEHFLKIFYLVVHCEMEHEELLPHLVQSAFRYTRLQENSTRFEILFVSFLKNVWLKHFPRKKLVEELTELKKKTQALYKIEEEKQSFEFFDYLSWIESKISKESYAAILKKAAAGE